MINLFKDKIQNITKYNTLYTDINKIITKHNTVKLYTDRNKIV